MDKKAKIILGLFTAVVIGIIISEIVRPRPIDWRPSYTAADKIPFGCFVLFEEMKILFPQTEITKIEESVYDVLTKRDSSVSSNYMLINDYIDLDKQETNQLLNYVEKGNTVFIAANSMNYLLADTLKLDFQSDYSITEDTVSIDLTHKKFEGEVFNYSRGLNKTHIVKLDTSKTQVLGHIRFERKNHITQEVEEVIKAPNFIKINFGKGNFYIHATPQVFSNYYMLRGNTDYVSYTLSYIDDSPLFWDNYKKAGRVVINSPMRFVLNQTALKWTYYLTIIGVLLFVLFRAKREQRIIPILEPNENSSVAFTRTVGSLYYQNKDHSNIVEKKIRYFMAHLRNRYHVDTSNISEKTIQQLANISAKPVEQTKELLEFIVFLKGKTTHTEQDIINLNKKITEFKA